VLRFAGIPYAAPPVGTLRFAEPGPPAPWPGTRDATRFGAAPPQTAGPLNELLGIAPPGPTREDCLTLNVFTPAADGGRRPVLVWIHGGAFVTGASGVPLYDGSRLAARGDAVVVTFNYRVGALGFLGAEGVPANLGLRDQVAALRFVREHIADFGGDPGNVTLFGESAGAGSIVCLLAMPEARGLFGRAIVQSAAPRGMIDREEAARRAGALVEAAGAGVVAGLRLAPVDALLGAQDELLTRPWATGMLFPPVVGGPELPHRPVDALDPDVEIVIGTTAEEMRLFARGIDLAALPEALVIAQIEAQLPGHGPGVLARYRELRPDAAPGELLFAIQSEWSLRYPATVLAERHPRARMYRFTARSPLDDGALGSCHALDLPFTLGNLDAPGMAAFAGEGPEVEALAGRMMDAWLAFARSGDPGHEGIGAWPRYDAAGRATMELGAHCGVRQGPAEDERRIFAQIEAG
jgi:para-nitrobenzyl esterase